MKYLVGHTGGSYTFDVSLKKIIILGFPELLIDQITLITNVKNAGNNIVIYQFNKPGKGGTLAFTSPGGIPTNTITLDFDTTSMDDDDPLQLWLEGANLLSTEATQLVIKLLLEQFNFAPAGTLKTTLFDGQTGSRQIIDLNGAAKIGEATILIGDAFSNIDPSPNLWDKAVVGSGTDTFSPGTHAISTGTTANSESKFQTVNSARFIISQFNIFHGGIEIPDIANTDVERRFGAFDPINATRNGAYFALIDGDWNVAYSKDGVEELIPQIDWNGVNVAQFQSSPGELAVYEIQYNAGSIFFFQGVNLLHVVSGLSETYASLYNFKVGCWIKNKNGNTTDNSIKFRALGIYTLGKEHGATISRVYTENTLIKTGAGFCDKVNLSRTGSGGGSALILIYDGIDATGVEMGRLDVGSDGSVPLDVGSTYTTGLYIVILGTGTISATVKFE